MNPWFETIAVIMVALLGALAGRVFSGFQKRWWTTGYFLSLLLIGMLAATRCNNALEFIPPFCWIAAGRVKLVVLSLTVTMGLASVLSRLPYKAQKVITCILMFTVVSWFCVLPFLVPALIKDDLLSLETEVDPDGICLQTKNYTCGPAAAVTALRKLGLPAREGQIAVSAHTSPVTGTFPKCLYTAIRNRYRDYGLKCRYRYFDSLDQITNAGVTLAVIKNSFLLDHCVAVLEVSDKTVTIADPAFGKMSMPREQFEKIWRFSGIVLTREPVQSI